MKKLLLIEDHHDIRDQLHLYLTRRGYACLMASDGETGVELAQENLPDLILCDVMLPGVSGFEVLEALMERTETAAIPIIFLSALSGRESVRRGMAGGGADYLIKPFTMDELQAAIDACFARDNRLRAKYDDTMNHLRYNISYVLPHELRTPLLGVIGYADMLNDGLENLPPERVRDFAAAIARSSRRLERVVENYLIYTQLEMLLTDDTARAMFRPGHSAADVIAQTAEVEAARVGRSADLVAELEPADLAIDADHLTKITAELTSNACKFSAAGQRVILEGRVAAAGYTLVVLDFGRGMNPTDIERVGAFMQFGRNQYEQQGTGLGLAIVTRLLRLHDGEIHIESKPNMETLVQVTLPLAEHTDVLS